MQHKIDLEIFKDNLSWLGEYYRAVDEKKLNTTEEKKAFFNDKNPQRMVEPDPAIFGEILHFLEH